MFRFRAQTALILLAFAITACGDSSEPLIPGSIQIVAGDAQSAAAGLPVAVAPSIKVLATNGKPMAGVRVTFASSGDGIVAPAEQVTNGQGVASVTSWTLPTRSGQHTLTVSTTGVSAVQIKATVTAGGAARLTRASPDPQVGKVGAEVVGAPIVLVTDAYDNPVAGVAVTFVPSHGQVRAANAVTDGDGLARAEAWTLGTTAGRQTVTASIPSASSVPSFVFAATAEPLAATQLRIARALAGNPRAGIALAVQPVIQITDVYGNAVARAGEQITAAVLGGVTVINGVAQTDATGAATFAGLTLTGTAGIYSLNFTASNYVPATAGFILEAGTSVALTVITQPSTTNGSGERLAVQPIVEFRDAWNNRVRSSSEGVTASLVPGTTQTLSGTLTVPALEGRAVFADLAVTGSGPAQLRFTAAGIAEATSSSFNVPATAACPGAVMSLNYQLGQTARYITTDAATPFCLDFTMVSNAGQQYLVQFENMSMSGNSDTGVFPGFGPADPTFAITVASAALPAANMARAQRAVVPEGAVHSWDFGAGEIFEIEPKEPVGGARAYVKRNNALLDAASSADIMVGDTIIAQLVGIARLGIPDGSQRAVVRYVGPHLIIAEDVRLTTTLRRQSGGLNTPLTSADMEAIAADYAAYGKVQGDRFFAGRHNSATESSTGGRPIAIHTLMFSDNIWGYTFSSSNYFAWDFWVGTDGFTKGLNQSIQRNSNNLFMHEIAHMRHWGMSERASKSGRANRWLIEGFARATERWPIAMRLLGTPTPSRTSNLVLPLHTGGGTSTLEDVPPYTQGGLSMYGGYATSSYVFDYFADQVAKTNGDWITALGDFLVNAVNEPDLNAAINRYLPGVDFGTLFTRARIAFYTDDYIAGLPDWTQYHQFQLRDSRQTTNPQLDPRNLWPKIVPGATFTDMRNITPGGAFGYVIDGTAATASARILLNPARVGHGVVSVTRIK